MPNFELEKQFPNPITGVDEVGRGSLAGPVVAAAVILPPDLSMDLINGIDDSKKLKKKVRERLFAELKHISAIGIGVATITEIDNLNILQATMLSMKRAVETLPKKPIVALIDGKQSPDLDCRIHTVVKGDSLSISIAAASIVAKVTRDQMMLKLAEKFPGYGWERNCGYGTKEHQNAIQRLGITSEHRRSFAPIRKRVYNT